MATWLDGNGFTAVYTALAFALVLYLFMRRPRRRRRVVRAAVQLAPARLPADRRAGLHSLPYVDRHS